MQNADNEASTSKATKAEEQQQQEEQEQSPTKIKTRSRFSAAFRSLSNKKPSKDLAKQQKPRSAEQLAEDLNSSESVPKRQSLTRRLLLGSLRPKTKARPHSDELSLRSSSGSRERGLGGNTLQITISGKKVETLTKGKAKPSKSKSQRTSAVSETDYLNPTPAETVAAAATGATAAAAAAASVKRTTTTLTTKDTTSRTTKLIVAKVSAQQQQLKKKRQQQLREAAEAPQTEEKIVITESTRDTPPRERAPAKPSRASASNNQLASSSTAVRIASTSSKSQSQSSRKERALMQQQQQRGHRLTTAKHALETPTSPQPEPEPEPEPESPTTPPPPLPAGSPPKISLSDVEQLADAVSLAESAQTTSNQDTVAAAPVVRFAVGSAVRSPVDAYEAALAAASTQQPSSSEEPSDSSLRRLSFKQQQPQFALSDHDSIEGRRETLRYQSVASEYSNEEDTQSEEEQQQQSKPMPAFGDLTMDQQMEPTIMSPSGEKREHLYKILVIGELGTGKTSFIKRYVHQFFSQNYRATIGVDFALKVLHWDANTIVRLQLWDIAGQERFGNMTRVYYKEAVGAFIVFDVTRSGTFDCVSKWKEDLDSKVQLPDGSPIPCILLANKCDQEKQGIVTQPERMDEYVRENGFAGWFETSAKENINIDEAARALVNKILINDKLITADANDAEKFNLSAADASADAKNKCSC
ncbi:uncharacterized protein Rab32 isoform X1 [Drosophila virilis]|uniref:Uncharacterized protein, isoform C n=1 Tax=Drosophila virilis TaxID=7244 RepID=B4ME48_DROVI|nr:mediator of RNA polymerase II transcription subunit 15 isoform X1 [Drosophila virilis]EDW58813.2 uncharacterized protein Dvir_GJ18542, isoform C [Drosophila virilis]